MVVLDTTTHVYLDADNNQFESVTRFINLFAPQFDFDAKSKKFAAKYGMDVEEVRASWKQKNIDSTEFGTLIHEQIENSLKNKVPNAKGKFKDVITDITSKVIDEFSEGDYLTEQVVYDKDYRIAGTSDLIVDNSNTFSVLDFKTNKQIKYTNIYEDKNLLPPINHLPNSEYFKYSLQLSFYAYFYNKLNPDKKLDRLCFYWLKRSKTDSYEDLSKFKWVRFNTPYLKEEVINCLNYAKEGRLGNIRTTIG